MSSHDLHQAALKTIALPRPGWERREEHLSYTTDPPQTMVDTIVRDAGGGQMTGVNVWDTAGAIADFYIKRVDRSSRPRASQPASRSQSRWPLLVERTSASCVAVHADGLFEYRARSTGGWASSAS
jgi:hypothetical protein